MKRTLAITLLAGGTTLLLAGPVAAQPVHEPASCQGYLGSYANPNMGFITQQLLLPAARDAGVAPGSIVTVSAQQHLGGLEPCIP